ncbi:50S ribosomal protein L25/general stress protein Ctc [Helicobacter sp. 12S02232-10]|uniref:50S ribosomal protein L25/general stress protein Ctc n=1 Tax=Helicobacter sp. 12S02232-10 TaxID=1476197 RepID=UPI000BA7BDD4|nr:50S ribosomal protein L25/general stress protein Ctc [Helicobacter sp. 12S02232-10]PAF48921.1 50S ribosomal protein L25/general stress protein Ctc [Helicobacter sp. 12S02232-10]
MLEGIIRESISKANTKALRNDGYLIANIYGKGVANIHCAFKMNDFIKTLKTKTTLIFPVKVGSQTLEVVVQEYQKDPVSSNIVHVDLLLAQKGIVSKYKVPVKISGIPVGLKNKGVLLLSKKRITVESAPENLPASYDIDVSKLDVGDSVLIRDLAETSKVKIIENPSVAVVGVIKAK